jgi:uncharacterized integral membrane protein
MANPEHVAELDGLDRLTVRLYRAGLVAVFAGVAGMAALLALGRPPEPGMTVAVGGGLLSAFNVHLYDRSFRWFVQANAAGGAWLVAAGALLQVPLVVHAGLGFGFVAVSVLALKERLCFRIPGQPAVPALLALSLIPLVGDVPALASAVLAAAALPLWVLAAVKLRQPLHFDIGDKSRYQI